LVADRTRRKAWLMALGSLLIIPVYLIMAYHIDLATPLGFHDIINIKFSFFGINSSIPAYLIIPMAMMGIAFSLVPAVMWPMVAIIVDNNRLGTAYGLMTMIQNIGLFSFNIIIGLANDFTGASADNPGGYNLGMWIFSILGFCGLLFAFRLGKYEKSMHHEQIKENG